MVRLGRLFAIAVLLIAASPREEFRADQIRETHRYDSHGDRIVFGGFPFAAYLNRQGDTVDSDEARTLYFVPTSNHGDPRVLYRAPAGTIINEFSPARSGQVAVVSVEVGTSPEAHSNVKAARYSMKLLDADGSARGGEFENVRDFQWNPDGDLIAYCTGEAAPGKDDLILTGTWILDVKSGSTKRIFETGRHAAWARFDGGLYIYDVADPLVAEPRVLRYDPATGEIGQTGYKGIDFSSSGDFYFRRRTSKLGGVDIYRSDTNHSILKSSKALSGLVPQPIAWLEKDDLLLFETWYYGQRGVLQAVPRTRIYDPSSDSVIDVGLGGLVGFDGSGRAVLLGQGAVERWTDRELRNGGRASP
jgi:hypothetical protein